MDLGTIQTANTVTSGENKIVRFENITDFDFTSEMGAMYGGVPYFVAAGKSMLCPQPIGQHLAKHLARQIIIRNAPLRTEKELDGKGSDKKLWDDKTIQDLADKMVKEAYVEETKPVVAEADRMAAKVAELNKEEPSTASATPTSFKDKKEVIEELKKRNIAFDARQTKATLEKLLA